MSFLFFKPLSWLLGLVDFLFLGLGVLGKRRPKFFSDGWGDLSIPHACQERILRQLSSNEVPESFQLKDRIEWANETSDSWVTIQEGRFLSPLASMLPEESKYCRFHLVSPTKETNGTIEPTHVIMLPATGEMGKSTRLGMAKSLANQFGWSSVIVTAPFYGRRKPKNQKLFFINNVSDFLLQSQSIVQEASALARYFLHSDPASKVCITGFSWGAAMSAISSGIALLSGCDASRLVTAPYVGSSSPNIMVKGILQSSIDFDALKTSSKDESTEEDVRNHLFEEFNKTQLKDITGPLQETKRNKIGAIKVIGAYDDHFITRAGAQEFLEQTKSLGSTTSSNVSTKWIPGGHIVAMLLRPYIQKKAIVEAIRDLKKIA